ncbi:MAG TPA: hypothetical protein VGE37_14645, partial [Archangium sp.]
TATTSDGGMAYAPELTLVDAYAAGRTGKDLKVVLKGKDRNLDAVSAEVRLLDGLGSEVFGFDLNHDGSPESALTTLPLEGKRWVTETVTATVSSPRLFAVMLDVQQVGLTLVDATGLRSEETVVSLQQQSVLSLGEACDATYLTSRCEPGFGCRGTPAVCSEGQAPTITRMAFYRNASGGPTILLEGTEPEDDLSNVRFQFQNASGQFISIDSDGDGQGDLSSFDYEAAELAIDGTFFIRLTGGEGLDLQAPKLVATASDGASHVGAAKIVTPSSIPVRSAGQTCDVRGFDICGNNLSCSPGIVGQTNKCMSASPMRTSQCTAAPILEAGGTVNGFAEGGSLWDAPAGCQTYDPKGRPEGVVKLRLSDRAAKLTLSTVGAGTTFDTALYVLPACSDSSVDALGCNDDLAGAAAASELVLTDVPAGDYLVIVDSFQQEGGAFQLSATVE